MNDTITYKERDTAVTETEKTLTLQDVIKLVVRKVRSKVDNYVIYEDAPEINVDHDYGDQVTINLEGYKVDMEDLFDSMDEDILIEMTETDSYEMKKEVTH